MFVFCYVYLLHRNLASSTSNSSTVFIHYKGQGSSMWELRWSCSCITLGSNNNLQSSHNSFGLELMLCSVFISFFYWHTFFVAPHRNPCTVLVCPNILFMAKTKPQFLYVSTTRPHLHWFIAPSASLPWSRIFGH